MASNASPKIVVVDPFDYVVFGGTGDLALRKLYPALYYRELDGQLPEAASIIAVARSKLSRKAFVAQVEEAARSFIPAEFWDDAVWERFSARLNYAPIDLKTEDGYAELNAVLDQNSERVRVFYLALPPSLFGGVCDFLQSAGLVTAKTRVVLEKPIGTNLATSREVNDAVGRVFEEHQIYRIDHYLGKETVQNLLALRFGNILFERVWSSAVIDHVQITVAEDIGLGDRAGYYDRAGALRDMIQNHLLQLLCLTAMEAPHSIDAEAVRNEKLKVLNCLRPLTPEAIQSDIVRGQYTAGAIDGESVPGYADELKQPSDTETFVAIKAQIDNWRWAGVPFYLRTGKRLPRRVSEIVITFRDIPHSAFPNAGDSIQPNRLTLNLQPDEGVRFDLMTKVPGPGGMQLRQSALDLSFAEEFGLARTPDAYERLLLDVVRGNSTLFMRRDEVEAAWTWVEPILDAWSAGNMPPKPYPAGTWGPMASALLINRDDHRWLEDSL